MQDHDLLRDYVLNHSEAAFAKLVARHINLVFATARRVVVDADLAKDVTQNVFIHLARKAGTVRNGDALPGWLYRVTCNLATSAVRSEHRRHERETAAMNLAEIDAPDAEAWAAVAPMLEEAMQRLNAGEQDAVLLRFFEGKSLREVGVVLELSDDAAQKRISRALEKMRQYFTRHGVTASAAVLGALLATHSAQAAPAGLAVTVAGGALASTAAAGGVGLAGVATKKALAVLAAVLLAAATAVAWSMHTAKPVDAGIPLAVVGTPPPAVLRDGAKNSLPETLTLEAPLNVASGGHNSQFIISSLRSSGGMTAIVRGEGTVNPIFDPDAGADDAPKEYFLEYQLSWQVFSAPSAPGQDQAVSSKDDFEIHSSATLLPDTPFPLMRVEGKLVTLMTDGKKITLQIVKER